MIFQFFKNNIFKLTSYFFGYLSKKEKPKWIVQFFIKWFIKHYKIKKHELTKDLNEYKSFNSFFSRSINLNYRPFKENKKNEMIAPCDGYVINSGLIEKELIIKNFSYNVENLIFQKKYQKIFKNGYFIHIYLRPKDYHRVHVPLDCFLNSIEYFCGKNDPVKPKWIYRNPLILQKNERLIHHFNDEVQNYFSIIKIGALNIGKINSQYFKYDFKKERFSNVIKNFKEEIFLEKGQELAKFEMGSCVIIFLNKFWKLKENINNKEIFLGQKIANKN